MTYLILGLIKASIYMLLLLFAFVILTEWVRGVVKESLEVLSDLRETPAYLLDQLKQRFNL